MADSKTPTHNGFALRREGKKHGRWLEIATGRLDSDGVFHAFLDRTPIGGFNGYVHFAPIGTQPPLPEPDRPAQASDAEEEELGYPPRQCYRRRRSRPKMFLSHTARDATAAPW